MKRDSNSPNYDYLYSIAERQGGYFSARQAQNSGITRPLLSHHANSGRFVRAKHGIYRLAQFPESPYADLHVAILETRSRGVLSHETALALYELSDNIPSQIHITVPQSASRRHPGLKLHTNRLGLHDIAHRHGLALTTVERTLADVITGGLAEEQAQLAIRQALERGLVSKRALINYANRRGGRMKNIITSSVSATSDQ